MGCSPAFGRVRACSAERAARPARATGLTGERRLAFGACALVLSHHLCASLLEYNIEEFNLLMS